MKKIIFYLFLFIFPCLFYVVISSTSHVRLNEIVACNHSIFYDNNGTFNDYIELYNSSYYPIDVSGYHLSDNKKKLNRYTFPKGSVVNPKSYYILLASNPKKMLPRDNHYSYVNFSLKNGEKIYFSDKNGKVIDKIKIPRDIECDVSYSRLPFTDKWAKRQPSPGRQNPLYKKAEKIFLNIDVQLGVPSGFYDEPFQLQMVAPEGFDIYYTLDSTQPTKNSLKYTSPIIIRDASPNSNKYSIIDTISTRKPIYTPDFSIDKATIVRAIAIRRRDGAMGNTVNATYFVGFKNKKAHRNVPIVSIITDPENLFGYEKGIYTTGKIQGINPDKKIGNYSIRGWKWAREAEVSFFSTSKKKQSSRIYQMKIHGDTGRKWEQKSFSFCSKVNCSESFVLDAGGGIDSKKTKIRSLLIRTLTKRNMLDFHDEIVSVFLNGEYWGVYVKHDRIDMNLISKNLNINPNEIILIKDRKLKTNIKTINEKEIRKEFNSLNSLDEGNISKIDVDNFATYFTILIYIANTDVGHDVAPYWNETIWKSLTKNKNINQSKKWAWILSDIDNSLFNPEFNSFLSSTPLHHPFLENPIATNLLKNNNFRKKFIITFQDISNYDFEPSKVNRFLDKIQSQYLDAMTLNFQRFQKKDYKQKDYIKKIDKIRYFFNHRFDYIMPYMKDYFNLKGDLIKIYKLPSKEYGGTVLLNTLKLQANEEYTGRYFSDYAISLDVETFPGYQFEKWIINDQIVSKQKLDLDLKHSMKIEAVWGKKKKNE